MNKKNIKVDFEYDYDFLLVGICTPLKEYTLSYLLNKQLQTSLKRSQKDVAMTFDDGLEKGRFSQYEFWDEQLQNQWYLIANTCKVLCAEEIQNQGTIFDGHTQNRKKVKKLIPENSNTDYFLQIHGIFTREAKLNLLKKIKNLDRIVSAHFVTITKLKSKENLII